MSSRNERLRLIQVGMGGWGRDWYRSRLQPEGHLDVVAIVDPSREALDVAVRDLGVEQARCFTSLESAIASTESEAVLVTASLPGHVPAARTAIAAGKHVLMEKPFAPSVSEARAVAAEAIGANRLLMISQNYRYFPAPQRAAQIVASGELGRLGVVHVDFRRGNIAFDAARQRHYDLQHPLLADMAIHHFDLMRMIVGADARRIRCHSFNLPWSAFRDDPAAEAVVEMENAVVVTYRGSWVSQGAETPWAGEWRLEFEHGELFFTSRGNDGSKADELVIRRSGARPRRDRLPKMEALDRTGSLRDFVSAIRDGRTPATSGESNIGSIGLTYAAVDAARTGGWVTVER